jgi:hypothetical protein
MLVENVVVQVQRWNEDDSQTLFLYAFDKVHAAVKWDKRTPIHCDLEAVMKNGLKMAEDEMGRSMKFDNIALEVQNKYAVFLIELEDYDKDSGETYNWSHYFDIYGKPLHRVVFDYESDEDLEKNKPEINYYSGS